MDTIGNARDARFILDWVNPSGLEYGRPRVVSQGFAPLGWRYLGSGSFRSVWRSPDGVAYKVQHGVRLGSNGNEQEYENLLKAQRCELPDGVRLPSGFLYYYGERTVMAMEVIEGVTLDGYEGHLRCIMYDLLSQCEHILKLWDLHDQNAMVDEDEILVLVDLGS